MQNSRANSQPESLSLTNDINTTPALQMTEYAGGMMYIDGSDALTFYASDSRDGTYLVIYRYFPNEATPVSFSVGAGAYPLPLECYAAAWVKIVATSGTLDIEITKKA